VKLIWLAALCAATVTHAQTRWDLATGYSATSFHAQNLLAFAKDAEASTSGQLKIDVHAGGSLIKLPDIPKSVSEGRVQAGETIMTNLAADMPIAGADTIPFVVKSYGDARRMWSLQRPLMERDFVKQGLKVLYAVPWPPQGLYAKKPLKRPADLKGVTMRTYNQSTVRLAELLGAHPVAVSMSEVNAALSSGKVESMITSAVTGVENKVWANVQYYYPIDAWFPKNIVFSNLKAFQTLSPANQSAVLAAADRAEARGWLLSQQQQAEATEELQRQGMTVGELPVQFTHDFKRLSERFSIEWLRATGMDANQIFIPYYSAR
jgi:TRAP-type transport system periplasmic protein